MGLAVSDPLSTFDQGGNREDLSDILASIIAADRETTLQLVGIGGEATATKHEWVEDELSAWRSASAATLATGATSIAVTASDGEKFRIGTLFQYENEPEVIQVTAVSTDTLTIVRGYGSTSDPGTTYASLAVIVIISQPTQEGTDAINFERIIRTKEYNFTQIFAKWINVSGTQEAVKKAGVASEVSYQTTKKMMELMRQLNINLIRGIRSADAGSDTSYRSAGGLIEFLSQAGGNSLDASGNALTETRMLNLLGMGYDDGGEPDTIIAGSFQKQAISSFWKEYIRTDQGSRKIGSLVSQYECDYGLMNVLLERYMPPDTIIVLDSKRCSVPPLTGRAMGIEPLAKTGDNTKEQLLGEYTVEVKNAKKAHGIYTNLATS